MDFTDFCVAIVLIVGISMLIRFGQRRAQARAASELHDELAQIRSKRQRGAASPRALGAASASAIALATPVVSYYEGYIPHTYADPVGIPTICVGHTGADVTPGRVATKAECDALLQGDLAEAYGDVQRCIGVPLQPTEAAALISFTFNVGGGALCTSTLARIANAGAPAREWCAQMDRWNKGRVFGWLVQLPGLVKRRAAERAMCEGRDWHVAA